MLKHPHTYEHEHSNHQATGFGNSVCSIGVHANRPELKESLRERLGIIPYEGFTIQRTAARTVARFSTGTTVNIYLGLRKRDTHYPPQKSMLSTMACPWNWLEQPLLTTSEAATKV